MILKYQIKISYALFELISIIEQDAKNFYNPSIEKAINISNECMKHITQRLNINFLSIYQLANFSLFPVRMADMWEAYIEIQKQKIKNNKFTNTDESVFYEFILNCKKILANKSFSVMCCEEHKTQNNMYEILYCKNQNSIAYYLRKLTKREPIDLFKI